MYITSGAALTHPLIANLSTWSVVGHHVVRLRVVWISHLLHQPYMHINGFCPVLKDIITTENMICRNVNKGTSKGLYYVHNMNIWLLFLSLVFYWFSLYVVRSHIFKNHATFPNFHHSVHKTKWRCPFQRCKQRRHMGWTVQNSLAEWKWVNDDWCDEQIGKWSE